MPDQVSGPSQGFSSVPSDSDQPLPEEPGYVYGSILPFRAQASLAKPGQAIPGTAELALPGVIRSAVNELTSAVTLPGRTVLGQVDPASLPQEAIKASLALMGSGIGVNSLTGEAVGANVMGTTRGFHGTPQTFEPVAGKPFGEFSSASIGSGEGGQAYGYGHYIAENPEVAKSYMTLPGTWPGTKSGNLLSVEMKPEASQFLDWDKGLAQQSPEVQSKLTKLLPANASIGPDTPGADLYHYLSAQAKASARQADPQADMSNAPKLISKFLHDNGIPGVKYKDQGSRAGAASVTGTNNYVVFHPDNIKITGRNGQELEPVDHDPFAQGAKASQQDVNDLLRPGGTFRAGPGKISGEHEQMMQDLFSQALQGLKRKGPEA